MTNQVQIFNFETNEVRIIKNEKNEVYFVALDVCRILELEEQIQ
jgi:prophage antirepressor-like protein